MTLPPHEQKKVEVSALKGAGLDVNTLTLEERQFLLDVLPPMRDPRTGRFLRGKLGGPPARNVYNFRAIVAEYVTAHGGFVEDAIIDLFHSMMNAARRGDVAAAKLLLDKFCGKDPENVDVDVVVAASTMSDTERAARLNAILAAAAARNGQPSPPRITVADGPNTTSSQGRR